MILQFRMGVSEISNRSALRREGGGKEGGEREEGSREEGKAIMMHGV